MQQFTPDNRGKYTHFPLYHKVKDNKKILIYIRLKSIKQ